MAHAELSTEERRQIERLRLARTPLARIAARLRRHRSTIYRELRRNRFVDQELPELDGYWGVVAHEMATGRRRRRRKLVRMPLLPVAVADRLRAGWSPEQIAGRLRVEPAAPHRLCHKTIHRFVHGPQGQSEEMARYLPERRRRRRPRLSRKPRSTVFPDHAAIRRRPETVGQRAQFGHWEAEMIFRKEHGLANVATLVERTSRYVVLFRNNDRQSKPIVDGLIDELAPLPAEARRSITFDRGSEFAARTARSSLALVPGLGSDDPHAPWQKGTVENTNRRARR